MIFDRTRRASLRLLSGLAVLIGARPTLAAVARTPSQTEGPFYPPDNDRPGDIDNDLVHIEGEVADAGGEILKLSGQVTDPQGAPIANALVEIWQCDANGRYIHSGDSSPTRKRDVAFQGYGRVLTGHDGGYWFRTIRPVPYPGRTPHIHVKATPPGGRTLTTQMYVAGEPGNGRDRIYNSLSAAERESVTVELTPASSGGLEATFKIVV